ncbi:MAG: hypothetical protein U0Y68_11200 [Blastocatellia bacterium]
MSNDTDKLQDATRAKLDQVSRALLRLHKSLMDDERVIYEMVNGPVASPHEMFHLVINHPQFNWLGKISSLVALIDEAASVRRPATETTAQGLLDEAVILLSFKSEDQTFVERLQRVLKRSAEANASHEEALKIALAEEG